MDLTHVRTACFEIGYDCRRSPLPPLALPVDRWPGARSMCLSSGQIASKLSQFTQKCSRIKPILRPTQKHGRYGKYTIWEFLLFTNSTLNMAAYNRLVCACACDQRDSRGDNCQIICSELIAVRMLVWSLAADGDCWSVGPACLKAANKPASQFSATSLSPSVN